MSWHPGVFFFFFKPWGVGPIVTLHDDCGCWRGKKAGEKLDKIVRQGQPCSERHGHRLQLPGCTSQALHPAVHSGAALGSTWWSASSC